MGQLIFITGGARSGKSSFAQKLAEKISEAPIYLATARVWDEDFKQRIKRHQQDRGEQWQTIEREKQLAGIFLEKGRTVVLDCVTLWLNNIFHDSGYNLDKSLLDAKKDWDKFSKKDLNLIVVSNELGMGIHPVEDSARKFTDLQGWMNQHIAKKAKHVYLMVSGIPNQLK